MPIPQDGGEIGAEILRHLAAARRTAHSLFQATRSADQEVATNAAQGLLELAICATSLVEDSALLQPNAFRKAAKFYPFFPVLLASKGGRDTTQKLARIENLPIGENWPFKRLSGPARNDDLRSLIEDAYSSFQRIRKSGEPSDNLDLAEEIRGLPNLSKHNARRWAVTIVRYYLTGPGGADLLEILPIDLSKETSKKKRRKKARLSVKFDGRELDSVEETCFDYKQKEALRTPTTPADKKNAFVDFVEKRLRTILRF